MRSQRVLIVEDDAAVSRVLARVFDRAGWDAAVAPNGRRALEILNDVHVDVMITDISMPKMTGRELCEHLQSVGPYLPACVLVVTSRTGLEERHWVGALPVVWGQNHRKVIGHNGKGLPVIRGCLMLAAW